MSPSSPRPQDVSAVARGGAFTLLGSVVSAAMGLLFVVVVGRMLGTTGSGVVFQGIAAFTITMSIARMGLDTTAVWLLPRLMDEDPGSVRSALTGLLVPALALGAVAGTALILLGPAVTDQEPLAQSLRGMGWALPAATVTTVALAATRALGGMKTYVGVGSIAIPTSRPLAAWLAVAAGGAATAVALSWTVPFHAAAVLVVVVLLHQLRRRLGPHPRELSAWVPHRQLTRRTWSFALPRAVATGLEQAMTWLDVLIVGLLAGPAAAGIYGAATRFVGAGMLLSTSLRIVVAPMYSRHLGAARVESVQQLYSVTTRWIVLFSAPIYVVVAMYGGTMLRILGPTFREGAAALAVLASGMGLVLIAGNIQSVLLMSGHSALAAINKAVAVTVNVALLFLLVPQAGLLGAAVSWVAAMVVDTGLALWQATTRIGLRAADRGILLAMLVVLTCVGAPAAVFRLLLDDTLGALLLSIGLGGLLYCAAIWVLRVSFDISGLAAIVRRRTKGA